MGKRDKKARCTASEEESTQRKSGGKGDYRDWLGGGGEERWQDDESDGWEGKEKKNKSWKEHMGLFQRGEAIRRHRYYSPL